MTRKISDEEKELWKHATSGVKNAEAKLDDFLAAAAKVQIRITPIEEISPLPAGGAGGGNTKRKALSQPSPAGRGLLVPGKINAMDGGSFRRLLQGRQKIEATLDLHGMWVNDAHIAVRDFIEMGQAAGKRCVLVITGKGGITGQGKIRAEFSKWLNDPDIRRHILSFTHARPEHGGEGAFYVYLRK